METKIMLIFALAAVSFLLFTSFTRTSEPEKAGKEIFEHNCARCHGIDGTKGKWGAKNLKVSTLSDTELLTLISNGKRAMPAWNQSLSQNEVILVKDHIKTLRD
jgi:cytochrome c6